MSKKIKYIPVKSINVPNGGLQMPPPSITSETPVYSTYTGNLIGYGPIPKGTLCDAPVTERNYGKPYHVVVYNPLNESYMAHYYRGNFNLF